MTCIEKCDSCKARDGFICHGDFFTTGEYSETLKEFDIHGVSLNQKIDSVAHLMDMDTIRILKVIICDSNGWDYSTNMEIMFLLDEIISRLSNDNKVQKYSIPKGDDP